MKITKRQLRKVIREAMDVSVEPENWPRDIVGPDRGGMEVTGLPGESTENPPKAYWEYPGYIAIHVPAWDRLARVKGMPRMWVAATPNWEGSGSNTLAIELTADDGTTIGAYDVDNIPWSYDMDEDRALWLQAIREQWPQIRKAMHRLVR